MELEGFATGFNNPPRQPGFSLENDEFVISFSGVMCDEAKNIVSHGFEVFYDWTEVMKLVLAATKNNPEPTDIEESAEDSLREWLTSFQGWGLLSSLLPTERHRHFILALAYTSANWDERTGGPHSPEKIFDTVKFVYDNIKGKEIRTLVPSLGIWFEELSVDPEISFKGENERKKQLVIFIKAKWTLEVKFLLEKKRVNLNLVDWAAERVTKDILHEEQLGELEVPVTLHPVLVSKFRDAAWVRSYWNFMDEVEKEEVDSKATTVEMDDDVSDEERLLFEIDEDIEDIEDIEDAEQRLAIIMEHVESIEPNEPSFVTVEEVPTNINVEESKACKKSDSRRLRKTLTEDSSLETSWWALYSLLLVFAFICS